jgi:hypothetical protein
MSSNVNPGFAGLPTALGPGPVPVTSPAGGMSPPAPLTPTVTVVQNELYSWGPGRTFTKTTIFGS